MDSDMYLHLDEPVVTVFSGESRHMDIVCFYHISVPVSLRSLGAWCGGGDS